MSAADPLAIAILSRQMLDAFAERDNARAAAESHQARASELRAERNRRFWEEMTNAVPVEDARVDWSTDAWGLTAAHCAHCGWSSTARADADLVEEAANWHAAAHERAHDRALREQS